MYFIYRDFTKISLLNKNIYFLYFPSLPLLSCESSASLKENLIEKERENICYGCNPMKLVVFGKNVLIL